MKAYTVEYYYNATGMERADHHIVGTFFTECPEDALDIALEKEMSGIKDKTEATKSFIRSCLSVLWPQT